MKSRYTVCWLSGGVSSFIAAYLTKRLFEINELIYIDIQDQHSDTLRFCRECANFLNLPLTILKSPYENKANVFKQFRFINSPYGAKCTDILKRRPRKEWEETHKNYNLTYIWGYDFEEKHRIERLIESNPNQKHLFPLMYDKMTKANVHGLCREIGINRPKMYELGYGNNNCVGCVKGGMGYWNKIRMDFPEKFSEMAKIEREINATCLKDKNGRIFLDELDPNRGDFTQEIFPSCGIACADFY
jgi:3'-phosphoadenosine 5'-phosphosulfate sulfotransferase (PAPS reductase)/FAD synthetase